MLYPWLDEYCLALPGTEKDYKVEWEATRYLVGGKMYVMRGGDKLGKPIVTVKLEPAYGELLRKEYPGDIVPGYYMNKEHWNSVYEEGEVPEELLRELLAQSHNLVMKSLSKKAQREIMGE